MCFGRSRSNCYRFADSAEAFEGLEVRDLMKGLEWLESAVGVRAVLMLHPSAYERAAGR